MPHHLPRSTALAVAVAALLAAGSAAAQSPAAAVSPPASTEHAAPENSAPAASAPLFIAAMLDHAAGAARDTALSPAGRQARFQALVRQDFDLPAIARSVLGGHWRAASEDERAQFSVAFADYMVALYAPQMAAYGVRPFTVTGQRVGSDATIVSTTVAQTGGAAPVAIDWRTVKGTGGYRVTDVIVENVSLIETKRDEIGAVLSRSGGQVGSLIAQLRTLSSQAAAAH
jgi:phospholipid transport system substrate-binding protein